MSIRCNTGIKAHSPFAMPDGSLRFKTEIVFMAFFSFRPLCDSPAVTFLYCWNLHACFSPVPSGFPVTPPL